MHRFIVDDLPQTGLVTLPPDEAAHAARVLRLVPGDAVELIDGRGRVCGATLDRVERGEVVACLTGDMPSRESSVRLTLYMGSPKAEKLELITQKLTEIGVARVVPVIMERSVARGEESPNRMKRLDRIAREAVKQCGRGTIPQLDPPTKWPAALELFSRHDLLLIPWEEARAGRIADVHSACPGARDIGLIIGPEGGISAREIGECAARGARPVTLGPRILRAETAAIVASAEIMALWGDL